MFDGKQISKKLVGSDDERAVSPVIGVILMVAITVILAAVIAAFVMDLGSSMGGSEVTAAADISGDESPSVTVALNDAGNSDGVAVVAQTDVDTDDVEDDEGDDLLSENAVTGDVVAVLGGTGNTVELNSDADEDLDFTVHAYTGSVEQGDNIDNQTADNSVIGDFTLYEDS